MNPEQLNAWRVIPRLLMLAMLIMTYRVVEWFMSLPDEPRASGFGQRYDGRFDRRIWAISGQERMTYKYLKRKNLPVRKQAKTRLFPSL